MLLASCKTTYNTQSFDATAAPAAPDYSNSKYLISKIEVFLAVNNNDQRQLFADIAYFFLTF